MGDLMTTKHPVSSCQTTGVLDGAVGLAKTTIDGPRPGSPNRAR
jgi:hypothetical protein